MLKIFFRSLILCLLFTTTSVAEIIKDVKINGNKRLSKESIIVFSEINFGKNYNSDELNEVFKNLYNTKFFKDIDIKLIITDDKSSKESLDKINQVLKTSNLKTELINLKENEFNDQIKTIDTEGKDISKNMVSNMRNLFKSIEIAETEDTDLFYFLEDDYIHTKEAIMEMLFTYEKISSQLNRELFLCPADYPYLYSSIDDSKIFFGNMRHWRSVNETLITFLTSKKMINKYLAELKLMSTVRHHPMELKLHEIYKNEYCISPIPSLAMHATNINSTYGLPPNFDWGKIWEENKL